MKSARGALLAVVGLLYLLSVPWYRAADAEPGLLLGLPDWVAVAVACYVGAAVLNALAWLRTDVPDAPTPLDAPGAAPAAGEGESRSPSTSGFAEPRE